MNIVIERIYESFSHPGGYRVLVDRVWPRGVSKEKAHLDLWFKEIAPSTELRKWFNHDPVKWNEFKEKYENELNAMPEEVQKMRRLIKDHPDIILLYSAKDEEHNQAIVLRDYLANQTIKRSLT